MEEQNSLAKQNKIFSIFEKNEKKMKTILLIIVVCVIMFSSIMSLSFSYKSYKEVENIVSKEDVDMAEKEDFKTLIVSFSNGSLINCSENGCGSTIVSLVNDGGESVFYNISFVDVSGDGSYYEYVLSTTNQSTRESVPSSNIEVFKGLEIKPGESKDYRLSLNSTDGNIHENFQMRLQVEFDAESRLFWD